MNNSEYYLNSSMDLIHFFVRILSNGGNTLFFHGKPEDRVKLIHENIQTLTGIPVSEQRLIYQGRLLDSEHSLSECMIKNFAGLNLVGRTLSTSHPHALKLIDSFVSKIYELCKCVNGYIGKDVEPLLIEYLDTMVKKDIYENHLASYLAIFESLCVPAAIIKLYTSPCEHYQVHATSWVLKFLMDCESWVPKPYNFQCAPVVLEFCNLLKASVGQDDSLYKKCRRSLALIVKDVMKHDGFNFNNRIGVKDIFPFVSELAMELIKELDSNNLSPIVLCDFVAFLKPVKAVIKDLPPFKGGIRVPMSYTLPCYDAEVKLLYLILCKLLEQILKCFEKVKGQLDMEQKEDVGWVHYLYILKKTVGIAKLYQGVEDMVWSSMESVDVSLRYLIVQYAARGIDYGWIIRHKNILDFESRRHLVMLLLPEIEDSDNEDDELNEMLIDRSQLLSNSFYYVSRLKHEDVSYRFLIEFLDEEATGPGVLREWLSLVCHEIFNPQYALFVACPNDRARFFLNPASKGNSLHLEYLNFAGRMIALVLTHNIQVGIMLDRTFYLQLAGADHISLEDIKDADPYFYSSCKQILDMDPVLVDEDVLALTFVDEVEESGSMKVIELVTNGKNIIVNSSNIKDYVELLIHRRFVTSVADLVAEFAKGFSDIVGHEQIQKLVFQTLEFEDLNAMLCGKITISVEDWKMHTEYKGYKETDSQICWFWKIVEEMTAEQQKALLFFWTSLKHLPMAGFVGLESKLYIYKSNDSMDYLPSSHTCFYTLRVPSYPSMVVMRKRLEIITQDHVGCSFGTS